ncbi:hypothetical protein [uncultured Microbacterium sp.]|uniref:hypothetical protein n=1 Tax=uncultured Microbacterium sp. TaxID=191216 RepID=UPI00259A7E04|nr:hypothetical protein [uncultured Microbacterium sp.]
MTRPSTERVSAAAIQRLTGIKRYALEALQRAGIIKENPDYGDLLLIEGWMRKEFVTGKENIRDGIDKLGLAVPLTDPDLSPDLELTDANDADLARQAAQQKGIALSDGQFLTGWWNVHADNAKRLVEERSPILGVTGGLVTSGAWIEAIAMVQPLNLRKAFVVTRMTDVEIEDYRGHVPRINQTGTYFRG